MVLSDRLQRHDDVIAQPAGDKLILFDVASGYYYSLNELGARIWQLCDGTCPFSDVINVLESEYDAERGLIERDSQALASSLVESGLLRIGGGGNVVPQ